MPYEKEEDERSEINWDRVAVRGCEKYTAWNAPNYSLLSTHFLLHPLTSKLVPSPYKQGESAIRMVLKTSRPQPHNLPL